MLNKYTLLGIVSFISINLCAMDSTLTKFNKAAVFTSHKLGNIDLYHGKDGFIVNKDGKNHAINPCFLDKSLRNLNKKQLDVLQKIAQFEVKKFNNSDDYTLKLNHRGLGGGPALAQFCYWMTKGIGYGVPTVLATGTVVAALPVATGTGAAAGASAASGAAAKFFGSLGLKALLATGGTTASTVATGGAVVASHAVIGTVGTTAATNAVVTTVAATSATTGGYVAFVEGLATGIWAWAMALPTP